MKYIATKFKEDGEIESWEFEADSLEEAKDSVLEDENLVVEKKEEEEITGEVPF